MALVLGFGSALLDQLVHVPESFVTALPGQKGGMVLVDDVERRRLLASLSAVPQIAPGGSAANTVIGLAHLGVPARLLAKIGDDDAGAAYRRHAAEAGVDTSSLKCAADLPTGTCLSLITPDGERTMRTFLGAASMLSAEEIGATDMRGCTHLLTEGYMLYNRPLMQHVLQLGRAAGCRICLDLSSPEVVGASADLLPALLDEYVDMVFANEVEAAGFAGTQDPASALELLARHCEVAVVKLGAEGALLRRGQQTVHVPAEKVAACDTTGAGDLWAAGFLYGCLRGCSLQTAGRMGAAVAAAVVCVLGAALPVTTWSRLSRRLVDLEQEN
jgi:sugar/nucleoside kinase (ribokinase family)